MLPERVGPRTAFRDAGRVPDLGLALNLKYPFRVYLLGCADDCLYAGFERAPQIGQRIRDHFDGKGADFTRHHAPKDILMVWPVAHAAAEAYVFSAMLSGMPGGSVHRLGGWTQTSVKPSPLCRQQYEEHRRLLCNLCFKCGGRHMAKNCPKAVQGVEYRCPSCQGKIMISSRGQSVVSSPGQGAMQPLEPARS